MQRWTPIRERIAPVVLCAQLASAFYDTGLQMVVKERYTNSTKSINHTVTDDEQQKNISNFYMTYTMLSNFLPFVPAYFLARFGDRGHRKVPLAVPLLGYFISRALLLLVILLDLPVEVIFGGAAVYGLCGGFSSYWAGVMALVSLTSSEEKRSVHMSRTELIYGIAGFVGSIASGHLFQLYAFEHKQGAVLVGLCVLLYLFCFLYVLFVLKINDGLKSRVHKEPRQDGFGILNLHSRDKINIILLFVSAILYDIAVGGGMEILMSFVTKKPLNWDAEYMGYGNAAGFVIFFTSFLGVLVFSRCASDATMIIIGMVSFAAGIYFMAFVTATYMFYLARALTLFALIPMPTIRSLLSKQVQDTSYGKILISLQLSLTIASVVYSPIYTQIYQATLNWFPGFVFQVSSIVTVLAIIPISIVGCRTARQEGYERIQGN
ncbi:thymic stromal cotransporter homolog [Megalops cyprinoides]|uniref:thymic stromal cotransporter homolog n=1 Tax=Megalops cyprinoides TaxID=118141 RepID=UPI0018656211|nr:thymic stromal cotransporter homolog [Megalops cyprinoides]